MLALSLTAISTLHLLCHSLTNGHDCHQLLRRKMRVPQVLYEYHYAATLHVRVTKRELGERNLGSHNCLLLLLGIGCGEQSRPEVRAKRLFGASLFASWLLHYITAAPLASTFRQLRFYILLFSFPNQITASASLYNSQSLPSTSHHSHRISPIKQSQPYSDGSVSGYSSAHFKASLKEEQLDCLNAYFDITMTIAEEFRSRNFSKWEVTASMEGPD